MTKRYDMKDSYSGAWMREVADGDWVDYDDHVAALAAAESRGFERGRAEERRDVVAHIRKAAAKLYPHARGVHDEMAAAFKSAAHINAAKGADHGE
jgi:hypothetical protein